MRKDRGFRTGAILVAMLLGWAATGIAAEKATYTLSWLPIGRDAGFFVALEKGYYKQKGVDLKIERGFGSGNAVKKIASGGGDVGLADIPAQIIFMSKNPGSRLKSLGVFHDKSMYAFFSFKGSGITNPKKLEGKSVSHVLGDPARDLFPIVARNAGVDESKIKWVPVKPSLIFGQLLGGKVDAAILWHVSKPPLEMGAKKQGKELNLVLYSDYGVDTYSNGLFTTGEMLKKRPKVIRGIVDGAYRGTAWAVEHPREAVDIFLKRNPQSGRAVAEGMWKITVDHLLTKGAAKHGIGYQVKKKMQYTLDLVTKYLKLPRKPPVEDIYTNEFLPKLFPKRGSW